MEITSGYQVTKDSGVYKTVVREFNEVRGLWEDVVYRTVNGVEQVESRTPIYNKTVAKLSATPSTDAPPKPTKVNKPVFDMEPPKKPLPYTPTLTPKKATASVPGPMPETTETASYDVNTSKGESKYLYGYGIKNINISHRTYKDKGIFITKPMEIEGNVIEISLLSNEEHPLFDDLSGKATDRMTSIEYYIAYEENPSLSDWHAILPEDQKVIQSERLFFVNASATLRFYARLDKEAQTNVYKNGLKLDKSKWCLVNRGQSVQLLEARDLTAIYTIDYVPDETFSTPWTLNVNQEGANRVRQIDRFQSGTSYNKTVTLSKYPYIDYTKINGTSGYNANTSSYRPFEVYLRNASIAIGNGKNVDTVAPKISASENSPFTLNRTDYSKGQDIKLNSYSIVTGKEYKGFEYKQEKNKLIFSETFNKADIHTNEQEAHGNAEIEVQYEYLVTKFRLKIIIRKNTGTDIIVSPRVNDYQIKYKVMK